MILFRLGAISAASAVAASAFASHGLDKRVKSTEWRRHFRTAVNSHLTGALGTMLAAAMVPRFPRASFGAALLLAGHLVFAGSVYVNSIYEERKLRGVAPIGGFCLIAGFAALAFI
ncbi:MAG: hypothetical protein MHM6MM_001526 [Cercozoa sp. M6MM]